MFHLSPEAEMRIFHMVHNIKVRFKGKKGIDLHKCEVNLVNDPETLKEIEFALDNLKKENVEKIKSISEKNESAKQR